LQSSNHFIGIIIRISRGSMICRGGGPWLCATVRAHVAPAYNGGLTVWGGDSESLAGFRGRVSGTSFSGGGWAAGVYGPQGLVISIVSCKSYSTV